MVCLFFAVPDVVLSDGGYKVQCPYCDYQDTKVIDSRLSEGKDAIRRRRECLACEKRFTTYERREPLRLMVLKRDGTREPFDRAKLHAWLTRSRPSFASAAGMRLLAGALGIWRCCV